MSQKPNMTIKIHRLPSYTDEIRTPHIKPHYQLLSKRTLSIPYFHLLYMLGGDQLLISILYVRR